MSTEERRPLPERMRVPGSTHPRGRICFVGDSYIAGSGDLRCLGWVGRVCANVGDVHLTFYNLGIRGDTSELVAARWRRECEARLPVAGERGLVFSFGINDIAEVPGHGPRVPFGRSVEGATATLREASGWCPTIWIGPTPANEKMSPISPAPGVTYEFENRKLLALNAAFENAAREIGVAYLDLATPLSRSEDYLASLLGGDGIHCSAAGYDIIADHVERWPAWRKLARL